MAKIIDYQNKGFTLIELSIVLIIISLITAGITGGQSLIKQAEIKSVVSEAQGFKTALNTFILQYDALPGDMRDAESYWPGAGGPKNGDNDGQIDNFPVNGRMEYLGAWQELSLSGIIPGDFSGFPFAGPPLETSKIGYNVPGSKLKGGAFGFGSDAYLPINGKNGIYFEFGRLITGVTVNVNGALLEVADAVSVDKKLDDGNAETGSVMAVDGLSVATRCVDPVGPPIGSYDLNEKGQNCTMVFWM